MSSERILITGASGLLATEIICRLADRDTYRLLLVSSQPERLRQVYRTCGNVECCTLEELLGSEFKTQSIDVMLHTAFARTSSGKDYADSLSYTGKLLAFARRISPRAFINVSSQSVYGDHAETLWKETFPAAPADLYGMAKYAAEELTRLALSDTGVNWTNIRLCSISEKARFIRVFVQNALKGTPIVVTAPFSQRSFIDVRDAASGLLSLFEIYSVAMWPEVYNLGADIVDSIGHIAERVKYIAETLYGIPEVLIDMSDSSDKSLIGMDSSFFRETFDWEPKFTLDHMVNSLFQMETGGDSIPDSFKIKYLGREFSQI